MTTLPSATSGTSALSTSASRPAMLQLTSTGARLSAAQVRGSTPITSAQTRSPCAYRLSGMASSGGKHAKAPSFSLSRISPSRRAARARRLHHLTVPREVRLRGGGGHRLVDLLGERERQLADLVPLRVRLQKRLGVVNLPLHRASPDPLREDGQRPGGDVDVHAHVPPPVVHLRERAVPHVPVRALDGAAHSLQVRGSLSNPSRSVANVRSAVADGGPPLGERSALSARLCASPRRAPRR